MTDSHQLSPAMPRHTRALVVAHDGAAPAEALCALAEAGYDAVTAMSAAAALQQLARAPADPIVVGPGPADWMRETCRSVRLASRNGDATVIALGARAASAAVMALVGEVADDAVLLPAEPGAWAARLRLCALRGRARTRAATAPGGEGADVAAALRCVPDLFMLVEADGTIAFANRGGPRHTAEELQGANLYALTDSERREPLRHALARAMETGRPETFERQFQDQTWLMRVVPTPGGRRALVTSTDVTEWRRAEEALRAHEARTAAMFDALPDLYFRVGADGVFREVRARNPAELLAPAEDTVGRTYEQILPPRVARMAREAVERAFATRDLQVIDYELATPAGATHFEARIVVSGPDEVLTIVRDMTHRRRLEAQLLAADRMASLGTLAAGIAHEVNNPLAYVLLNLRHVAGHLAGVPSAGLSGAAAGALRERVDAAVEGVERVSKIVADLRTLARGDAGTVAAIDVHAVLDAALAAVHAGAAPRARIVRQYGDVPFVRASEPLLGQVFVNLLTNALQSLPEGGEGNEVRVSTGRDGDRAWIEVRDNGSGIPEPVRARIFDPFFTTRAPGEGTGLGLWICQRIVDTLRGGITVASSPGVGSAFRVHLPAAFGP